MRMITYCEAINEAIDQAMADDDRVFIYGIGVSDRGGIFNSIDGLLEKYGSDRCRETPIAEDTMTGVGVGAALAGMRPIHIHIRVDFLILAMNQLVNMMSTIAYTTDGELSVPIVIRAVIGRGWGQGSQHSKSLFSTFAHIPGLKVVAPTTPYDVKGLINAAIKENNPVLILEHRWLYWQDGYVAPQSYIVELGTANVLRKGTALTVVALSWMTVEAMQAAKIVEEKHDVQIEVIDLRSIAPIDTETIIYSVSKTRHCIVADNDWVTYGASGEIASIVYEHCFQILKSEVSRVGFAHVPCPTARHLEKDFYPNAETLVREIEKKLGLSKADLRGENFYSHENRFRGPF